MPILDIHTAKHRGKRMQPFKKTKQSTPEIYYSNWPQLINGSKFLRELGIHFPPHKAAKVISSVYKTSTVPLARDMQI